MDLTNLIEELQTLIEDEIAEETMVDEIEPEVMDITHTAEFNDTMSLADELDARTKVARALENLQAAVEEFKQATAEKVDLLQDSLLLAGVEQLDMVLASITEALASGSSILGDASLNDAFKSPMPATEKELEELSTEETEETEEDPNFEPEEEYEEVDFDTQAGLEILN